VRGIMLWEASVLNDEVLVVGRLTVELFSR
jgi:hypothetical protein